MRSRKKERTFLIITFCGHSDFHGSQELEDKIVACIKEQAKDEHVSFYLGGYGFFDSFALRCCKKYQEIDPESRTVFVSPYRRERYFKDRPYIEENYDEILIPDGVGGEFSKFDISKRNEWMVKRADFVIAYVNVGWGGAAKTLLYAVKHKKPFINFGTKVFDD